MSTVIDQKTIFWPGLYLPCSGRFSSLPVTRSLVCASHSPSPRFGRLSRTIRMKRPRKLTTSTTPIQGWMRRAVCPPPKSPVRKKSEGWKKPSPEIRSRIRQPAVNQWLARVQGP